MKDYLMNLGGLPKINETQAAGLNKLKKKIQLAPLVSAGKQMRQQAQDSEASSRAAIEKAKTDAYQEAMLDMLYADTILQQSAQMAQEQEDPMLMPPAPVSNGMM